MKPVQKATLVMVFLMLTILASACGSTDGGDLQGASPVQAGEQLFAQDVIGNQTGCKTCHSLEPDRTIVGPSLAQIGVRAGERVTGISAEDYIRQSILEPDAYVVEGYVRGTMPGVWDTTLTNEQLDHLVAYLLTLK